MTLGVILVYLLLVLLVGGLSHRLFRGTGEDYFVASRTVGPFLLLIPVTTVLGGVLVLGESLTTMVAIGGAIVIAGVAVIVVERRRPAANCAPAPNP